MKYAIAEISGRQFWIEEGKYYDFNRIPTELGKQITLNRVLLINDGENLFVGQPYLESVKIRGKILEHFRSKKTIVYKKCALSGVVISLNNYRRLTPTYI